MSLANPRLQCKQLGCITVVRLLDRILTGHLAVHQVGGSIRRALDEHDSDNLVLNFARVESVSASIVSQLIELKHIVWNRGGRVVITNLTQQLQEVFTNAGIDSLFVIKNDETEAMLLF